MALSSNRVTYLDSQYALEKNDENLKIVEDNDAFRRKLFD